MSNEEKRRRLNYRLYRKKRITFQIVLIMVLSIISLFSAVTFYQKDKASYIDYKEKHIGITEIYHPTGNVETDMRYIKNFYKGINAKYPESFCAD